MKKTIMIILSLFIILTGVTGCSGNADRSAESTKDAGQTPGGFESGDVVSTETDDVDLQTDVVTEPAESPVQLQSPIPAVIQLEGTDETVYYQIISGSFGYEITMDIDRFEFIPGLDTDIIKCLTNESVYMTVSFKSDTTAAEILDSLLEIPEGTQLETQTSSFAAGKYDATLVHIVSGSSPDSQITNYYIVEHDSGCYVIVNNYYLEAAEGWGARLYYMTDGFEIK